MRWRSLLWTASALVVASSDPFLATLNCERINPSFCCTSRIRDFCREKCADIECGPGFFNSRSKTDERQQATAREGDTSASSAMRVGVPSLTANAHQSSALINTGESVTPPTAQPNGQFPTLIPFQPEVVTSVTEGPIPPPTQPSPVLRTTTAASFVAPAAQEAAQPDNMTPPLMPPIPSSLTNVEVNNSGPQRTVSRVPRIRTTPDPRIIRPPESLAFISDFDEESGNDIEAVVIPANNMIPFENRQPEPPLGSEGPLPPLPEENGRHRHRSNENIPTPTSASPEWSVTLLRPGQTRPANIKTPNFAVDGSTGMPQPFVPQGQFQSRSGVLPPNAQFPQVTPQAGGSGAVFSGAVGFGGTIPQQGQLRPTVAQTIVAPTGPPSATPWPMTSTGQSSAQPVPDFRTAPSISGALEPVVDTFLHSLTPPPTDVPTRQRHEHHQSRSTSKLSKRPKYADLEGMIGTIETMSPPPIRTTLAPNPDDRLMPRTSFLIKQRKVFNNNTFQQRPSANTEQVVETGQCGVAPSYTPCVSSEKASEGLLQCCRDKNLPPGCQALCRYDVTQAEVKSALDKGQCGYLHVAPFLQCASQGNDNRECCRHKGVNTKAGPQCEQFCHPGQGLALGIQHLVCGTVMIEMLQCHHAGVRI